MTQFIENIIEVALEKLLGDEYSEEVRREYKLNVVNTRTIEIDRDAEGNVTHVGLFSVDTDRVLIPIFEFWLHPSDEGGYTSVSIHAVAADDSNKSIEYVDYNNTGQRSLHGGVWSRDHIEQRQYWLARGHLSTDQLPEIIDVESMVSAFVSDAVSETPSFEPPQLTSNPGTNNITL